MHIDPHDIVAIALTALMCGPVITVAIDLYQRSKEKLSQRLPRHRL